MNVKDAAATLGVSTQRVYALLKAGLLRGTRTPGGRRWADVDEMSVAHYQRSVGGRPRKDGSGPGRLLVADYQAVVTPDGTIHGNIRKRVASFGDEGGVWEIQPRGEVGFTGAYTRQEDAAAALMGREA
jgi:hypothetical protein